MVQAVRENLENLEKNFEKAFSDVRSKVEGRQRQLRKSWRAYDVEGRIKTVRRRVKKRTGDLRSQVFHRLGLATQADVTRMQRKIRNMSKEVTALKEK